MERIGKQDLDTLVQWQEWPAISIYMPVSKIGDPQDSLRYKNFIGQVEGRLVDAGMRSSEARSLLEPEYKLAQESSYWKHLGAHGLAVFCSGQKTMRYRLPVNIKELVTVGSRFHIKPLIPLLTGGRYLLLALSQKELRLFTGDRFHIAEIELPEGMPKSRDEALQYDDPEKQLQHHTISPAPGISPGTIYHGHGAAVDEDRHNLVRYFQIVDPYIFPALEDKEFPVILAGVDELQAVYRRVSKGHTILPHGVLGNVEELSTEVLCRRAWEAAAEYFSTEENRALQDYQDGLGGDLVLDDLQSILAAAYDGRVESLFVTEDEQVWGVFDIEKREALVRENYDAQAVDLLDEAVFWTLRKKGRVFLKKGEEMPADSIICARLRF